MKQVFEVTLTYTALVVAEDSFDAEQVALREVRDITYDEDHPKVEAGLSLRSVAELDAWAKLTGVNWDHTCTPYGGGSYSLGQYLAAIELDDAETSSCPKTLDLLEHDRPASPPHFQLLAARAILKAGDDWQWASMEWIGDGPDGACLIEGGVPRIDGQGRARWPGVPLTKVVVTAEQEQAQRSLYRAQTGNCDHCAGSGQRNIGWDRETGTKYSLCEPCGATGRAA